MTLVRTATLAGPPTVDTAGTVRVRGLLVPWDTPAIVNDGEGPYREAFARGSVQVHARGAFVYAGHDVDDTGQVIRGPLIGRVDNVTDDPDGLRADLVIADTTAGRDALALAGAGVADGLSVEFVPTESVTAAGVVTRTRAVLEGVALVPVPAYVTAGLGRTATVDPEPEPEPDPIPEPAPAGPPAPDPEPERPNTVNPDTDPDTDPDTVDTDDTARARTAARALAGTPGRAPAAARYRSFGEYAHARAAGHDDGMLARAFTDLVTADVPGLTPDAWIGEVVDLVTASMPTVQAFRRRPLPATGMNVVQPVITARPLVGKVTGQKVEIPSRKMTVTPESWPVETFAGGNDVSIQALRRTDPSVLTELLRVYSVDMANELNAYAAALLVAGADVHDPVTVDADAPHEAFTSAAKLILTSLRRLPDVAVLGVDLWESLANAVGTDGRPLFPGLNPSNPFGTMTLTSTEGTVRNLRWYVDPDLPPADGVVGVTDAFVSLLGGMDTMSADVPRLLGRDVAVYQFAAAGVTDATGLVKITATAAAAP